MYAIKFADGTYYIDKFKGVKRVAIWNKASHVKTKITYEKKVFGYDWYIKNHPELLKKWENAKSVEIEFSINIKEI